MNRNDRKIGLAALVLMLLALVGFYFGGMDDFQTPAKNEGNERNESTERNERTERERSVGYYAQKTKKVERFPFDPNTADSTQLLRLGLQPWQVRNIYKYRAKGGIYRQKKDFARLYGLTVKQYRELEPYIQISADYQPAASLFGRNERKEGTERNERSGTDSLRYPVKLKDDEHVVLNTADTSALMRVPGIGSFYAKEIVRHGRWLGGYVSIDQLDEIDGFPQEAKKYFVVQHAAPKKLNVNKLSLNELRRHPYINFYQAKAIVDYRRLHGDIKSLDDLRLSRDFPPEAIKRLEPYVEF